VAVCESKCRLRRFIWDHGCSSKWLLFKAIGGPRFSFTVFGGSQVLMDIEPLARIMHADMNPLWPLALGNGLLGPISVEWLHVACVLGGGLGAAVLMVNGKTEPP